MPGYIYESIIAEHYGWTLDYIRSLDLIDFYAHLYICITKEGIQQEFQARLAGASIDFKKSNVETPNKSDIKGVLRETKKEKIMNFSSKITKVYLDKNGNPITRSEL